MSTSGWVFQIGIRVLDVGLLVLFLVWMFRRMRDDDGGTEEGGGGGGGGRGPDRGPPSGGGSSRFRGRARQSARRLRNHAGRVGRARHRRGEPMPGPLPARVRRPRTPASPRRV